MALPQYSEDHFAPFEALKAGLEAAFGPLDADPLPGSGTFTVMSRQRDGLYVTCGLAGAPARRPSAEGLAYELVMFTTEAPDVAQAILAQVATHHADTPLEDGGLMHLDVSGDLPNRTVRFRRFDETPDGAGLYQVSFA